MQIGLLTWGGLASAVQLELRAEGLDGEILAPCLVVVRTADDDSSAAALSICLRLRTIRWVLDLGTVTRVDLSSSDESQTAQEITERLAALDVMRMVRPGESFAVRALRFGTHAINSQELARVVGSVVRLGFAARGLEKPPVALEAPGAEVFAVLRDELLYVGRALHPLPLDARNVFPVESWRHHAPLNPAIAAAMLRWSSFFQHGTLCDPMCGSGTILLEALATGLVTDVRGADAYGGARRLSWDRLHAVGADATIRILADDATELRTIETGQCRLIVTNPPYGIRMGDGREVDRLYRKFARAAAGRRVLEVVAITPRKTAWVNAFARVGYELVSLQEVEYGRLKVWVGVHRLVDREGPNT